MGTLWPWESLTAQLLWAAALGAAEDQPQPRSGVLMIPESARKHLEDGLFCSYSLSNASHAARREMEYFSYVTAGSIIH